MVTIGMAFTTGERSLREMEQRHATKYQEVTTAAKRIEQAAREHATESRGKLKEEKLADLLNVEFHCDKLKGRARFARPHRRSQIGLSRCSTRYR